MQNREHGGLCVVLGGERGDVVAELGASFQSASVSVPDDRDRPLPTPCVIVPLHSLRAARSIKKQKT